MNRTELQAIADRYLAASREVLGDTAKKVKKALPMPYPLNDDEFEQAPEQWSEYLKGCEARVANKPKWQPKKGRKRK